MLKGKRHPWQLCDLTCLLAKRVVLREFLAVNDRRGQVFFGSKLVGSPSVPRYLGPKPTCYLCGRFWTPTVRDFKEFGKNEGALREQ